MAERFTSDGIAIGINITVEVPPGGRFDGWDVALNGVYLWRRPYDGYGPYEAAREVSEALCELLRAHTGRTLPEVGNDDG
jgi:hypothetical protein